MNRVFYQGEPGSFSELAARKYFGAAAACRGLLRFEDVFRTVAGRRRAYGVIPIENTLAGSIRRNYDLLMDHDLWICGETTLRIRFNLFTRPAARARNLKEVWSHPAALDQCRRFLGRRPGLKVVPVYDTAGAAKILNEQRRNDVGIIAGPQVARPYRLRAVAEAIEDDPRNYTRFLVLGRERKAAGSENAKTSLAFGVKNAPGILFRCLSVFALRNIDLVKLESRPIVGQPWEYLFYIDFRGDIDDDNCRRAVATLNEVAAFTKVLGCYAAR